MAWYHRITNVFRSSSRGRQVDREMEFHLQERADALVASGMEPQRALREARRKFGNRTAMAERTHDVDGVPWLDAALTDVRYAFRAVRNAPMVFTVAVISMALGIGANIAIFSLINAIMLRPLPVREPAQLVKIITGTERNADDVFSNPLWEQIRAVQAPFDGTFAYWNDRYNLATGGVARMVDGFAASGAMFTTLGVSAATGRLFSTADDVRGCEAIVVLGNMFWRNEYGSSASAVGQRLFINGIPFRIIGVTESSFTSPQTGTGAQVFMPLCTIPLLMHSQGILDQRSNWALTIMGRLRHGVTRKQAAAQLMAQSRSIFGSTLPADWSLDQQQKYVTRVLGLVPAASGNSDVRSAYRTALLVLMGVVGIVLLIACANVAQLLVARAAARQREIAIRLALGASRLRLFRQLVTEGLLLSVAGAAGGLLFARWASVLMVRGLVVARQPVVLDLHLDSTALVFTLAVAILTGLVFGMAPAWGASQVNAQAAMKSGGRGTTNGVASRFGKMLVVTQVALSLVLVATGGLLLTSFRKLANTDPGFRTDGTVLVVADVSSTPGNDSSHAGVQERLLDRLRRVSGVSSVSASETTPLSHRGRNDVIAVEGYSPPGKHDPIAFVHVITPGYFATMGALVVAGRDFSESDRLGNEPVLVVDEATASQFFGKRDPIGMTVRVGGDRDSAPAVRVVGVVKNAKYSSMDEPLRPTVYLPLAQASGDGIGHVGSASRSYEIRTALPLHTILPGITEAARSIDPAIILNATTMTDQFNASIARPRLLAELSSFFAALALLLALIGLYGIVSYGVTLRRNEIGIRLALGAARERVIGMVLADSARLAVAGVMIGLLLTFAATRAVKSLLYGVAPTDPLTIAAATGLLILVALLAGAIPGWRASRVDPMTALRED